MPNPILNLLDENYPPALPSPFPKLDYTMCALLSSVLQRLMGEQTNP